MNIRKKRRKLSFRLSIVFVLSCMILALIFTVMLYFKFQNRMIEEYSHIAEGATSLMAVELDGDRIDDYLEQNFELEEYHQILERFYEIRNSYPDILYMYVYRLSPDGGTVIFDLNSTDGAEDAGQPGDFYEFGDIFMAHIDELCAGKDVGGIIGPTEDGYMLTYCKPIFDSQGVLQCHACVDFSIEALHQEDVRFMYSILVITGIAMIFIMLFGIYFIRRSVTDPLEKMSKATESFSYQTQEEQEHNIQIMRSLDIRTNDEIETVYQVFSSVMEQSLHYMQNLIQAENDIRDKEKQIGQISIKAFRDALTSVGNKSAYNSKSEELNEAIRNGTAEFGIVMLDANHLKYINDCFGHDAGDSYLKGCCQIICEKFKKSPVYRIGGDEFVVVLMHHDYENRIRLLDELIQQFADTYQQTQKQPWERYSMSVGMAEYTAQDSSTEEVFKRADSAMYAYKTEFRKKYGSYR